MATLHELLQPQVILRVISRVKPHQSRLSKWLGFQPTRFDPEKVSVSGPNSIEGYGRNGSYRIFDNSRAIAPFVSPGRGPAVIAQQPIGVVQFSYARVHAKMILDYESMGNLSPLIGPNAQIDPGGENFIAKQAKIMGQQFNNAVSFMAAGMVRGNFYLQQVGDQWQPTWTQPTAPTPYSNINYQVPAGNKSQLNMLGTGNILGTGWENATATIVGNLMNMKSALTQLTGYQLEHSWITSPMWYYLISNTEVRNTAGTAATPYAEYDYVDETDMEGDKISEFAAILKADPTIMWHISDEALALGGVGDPSYSAGTGTMTKIIPDTNGWFCPEPDNEWTQIGYGSEYVVEYNGPNQGVNRAGYYFWHNYVSQPSGVEIIGLLNCLPFLFIPKNSLYPTLNF